MKKTLLAVLLATSTMAMAEEAKPAKTGHYFGIKFETQNGQNGTIDANTYGLVFGKHINSWLDGEIAARISDQDQAGHNDNNTRAEVALIPKYKLTEDLTLFTRGGVGYRADGSDNNSYWTVEPGVKYALTSKVGLTTSVRFRDAFDTDNNQSDRTYKVGASYSLTDDTSIETAYRWKRGDGEYNAIGVGLKYEF